MLKNGDRVPAFDLRSHDGDTVSLASLAGQWVVLHTFPLAFTGG